MTVAEINALLYLPGHPASGLERAVRIPALSAGWRTSLEALLDRERKGSGTTGNPGLGPPMGPPPRGKGSAHCGCRANCSKAAMLLRSSWSRQTVNG